jgi:hypothetical protein
MVLMIPQTGGPILSSVRLSLDIQPRVNSHSSLTILEEQPVSKSRNLRSLTPSHRTSQQRQHREPANTQQQDKDRERNQALSSVVME